MQTFSIRVYGIASKKDQILLSKEVLAGSTYHKFPGGGLDYGEGPPQTLIREMQEEAAVEIEIGGHLYTLDYFVESQFVPNCQIIGVYYYIRLLSEPEVREENIRYYWLDKLAVLDRLSFSTDRVAYKKYLTVTSAT